MSPELIAILGVGIALAVFMFHILRRMEERLRQDIHRSEERMRQELHRSEERTDSRATSHEGRFAAIEARFSDMGERLARVEGLLEGLRDSITGRQAA